MEILKDENNKNYIKDVKYNNENFFFLYRVSALIFNKDKSKILLFYGNDMDYYMLPGGKVHQLEKSEDAIKREITEELGFKDLKFDLVGISEEIVGDKENDIQQITLTYKCIYEDEIKKESFKSIESNWINFKWVDINELDNYKIHPSNIKDMIKNNNNINHLVEIVNK